MRSLAVVLVVALCGQALADVQSFNAFISKYGKVYSTNQEYARRYKIYEDNMEKAHMMSQDGVEYGETKFADLTADEFLAYKAGVSNLNKLPSRPALNITIPPAPIPLEANPTPSDWTTPNPPVVTPVKDQGQCGSCWAFSTVANIEGVWALAGHPLVSLSESDVVDCTKTSYACSGGWPYWAMQDLLTSYQGRIDTEASYPYTIPAAACTFSASSVGATIKSFDSYCKEGTTPLSETAIESLLIQKGPLSVCLNATPMQLYRSGVDNPRSCSPSSIDHCVTLVGYGVDGNTKFWKIKNSWGTTWGEQGFYRLIKGTSQPQGACGIQTVITSAAV
eukprot:TRINITY_DN558_c0_g1_i1.p1 TRINITY_DN558_c0_g1~~TRINITY_DN558_c0_g1_i1.p1  ORF type:complete len:351 (-),score=114.43 TRINITY_DN558_c0_g1_i1:77-1081(-)